MNPTAPAAIAARFRRHGPSQDVPGYLVTTAGIAALPFPTQLDLQALLRDFDGFTPDNDPYGEHDFGALELAGVGRVLWKIDYYADADLDAGAEDPLACFRVLTLMLGSEY